MNNVQILIVDDDPVIIMAAEKVLNHEGYHAEGVPGGEEAIHALEQKKYELVITDLKMSGCSGLSLIRWLRQFRPATGIVVITGYLLPEAIKEAHKLGIISHLMKPYTPALFADAVKKALEWMTESVLCANEEIFPQAMVDELDEIIRHYRKESGSAILVLLHAQEIFGYLPSTIQRHIARELNVYPTEIHSIVSGYPCFRTRPSPGRASCHLRGSNRAPWGTIPKAGRTITDAVGDYFRKKEENT